MKNYRKILTLLSPFIPVSKKKIVFMSHGGSKVDCNPKYIAEMLLASDKGYDIVWLVNGNLIEALECEYPGFRFVQHKTAKAFYELFTAKVWVNNQFFMYYLDRGLFKREDQYYLQTWHGSLGLKRVVALDPPRKIAREMAAIDFFITNGDYVTESLREGFGTKKKALQLGHARTDIFFSSDGGEARKKVSHALGLPQDAKIVLYAPTFRDDHGIEAYTLDIEPLVQELSRKTGDTWVFLYRLHHNLSKFSHLLPSIPGVCFDASHYPSIQELLFIADAVVTDYSSCIYDFVLTKRPGFLYVPDLHAYTMGNPLSYPIEETPFPIARTCDELLAAVREFDRESYEEKVDAFLTAKQCVDDGQSSARAADVICRIIDDGYYVSDNEVTVEQARRLGFREIFCTWWNIGDNILLLSALKLLHERTGNTFLVATFQPELWKNVPFVRIIPGIDSRRIKKSFHNKLKRSGITMKFITGETILQKGDQYIRAWGPYHLLANYCSKLGISGAVPIKTYFYLSEEEKKHGRFFKKQIVVTSMGMKEYKTLPFEKMQYIVDQICKDYDVIQVGPLGDLPLENVHDMRGTFTIREIAGLLYNSDLYLGGIGAFTHMANAVGCRSVVLYSAAEPSYYVDYACNINVEPDEITCMACRNNEHCPFVSDCPFGTYSCIRDINPGRAVDAVHQLMGRAGTELEVSEVVIEAQPARGLEDLLRTEWKLIRPKWIAYKKDSKKEKTEVSLRIAGTDVFRRISESGGTTVNFLGWKVFKPSPKNMAPVDTRFKISVSNHDWLNSHTNIIEEYANLVRGMDPESVSTVSLILGRAQRAKEKRKGISVLGTPEEEHVVKEIDLQYRPRLVQCSKNVYAFKHYYFPHYSWDPTLFYYNFHIDEMRLHDFLRDRDALDAGAYMGEAALILSEYTRGRVHAFEPSPGNFDLLQKTIQFNEKEDQIIAIPKALNSVTGPVRIEAPRAVGNSIRKAGKNAVGVMAITVDDYVNANQLTIGCMKIHVEDSEKDVLRGAKETITSQRPVLFVSLEHGADSFFSIKPMLEGWNLGYSFHVRRFIQSRFLLGTTLICVPEQVECQSSLKEVLSRTPGSCHDC